MTTAPTVFPQVVLTDQAGNPYDSTNPQPVLLVGSGTFTSGGKATAAAPTYVEGSTNPLSLDLSGALRIGGTISATSAAHANAAAPSYTEATDNPFSVNLTGDLRTIAKQSGTWNIGTVASITNPVAVTGTFWQATQPISATSLPLPTGAATSALQTTGNTSLASIDSKLPALGQALAGASVPVVLTAAQITTLTPPTTVTANIGTTNGLALDATLGTLVTTTDFDAKIGSLTETAPATDIASSGLNGRLQRVAQRITSLIASTLATSVADGSNVTLGAKADAKSTATDTTAISAMSVWKQISASVQAVASSVAGVLSVSQSGTWTVQPGNTANTTAWKVDGSASTQPVSLASVPSHAVTNAGTFAVQATEADGSNVAIGATTDAVVAAGATGSLSAKLRAISRDLVANIVLAAGANLIGKVGIDQTTPGTTNAASLSHIGSTAVASGNGVVGAGVQRVAVASDNTAFSVNATVNAAAGAGGIASSARLASAAASTNATRFSAAACRIYQAKGKNNATYDVFLVLYDSAASPPVPGTTTIREKMVCPAGQAFVYDWPVGMSLGTGGGYAFTKLVADADTTAIAAADITAFNLSYT